MFSKKLEKLQKSKLSKTLDEFAHEKTPTKQTGFIKKSQKSALFKTKSFRLREADVINFENIVSYINNSEDRMLYSDSQVIRGLINYMSDNIDHSIKKLIQYIRASS